MTKEECLKYRVSIIIRLTDNISLIASDLKTVNLTNLLTPKTKATYLRKYVTEIEGQYGFIFFDVPINKNVQELFNLLN